MFSPSAKCVLINLCVHMHTRHLNTVHGTIYRPRMHPTDEMRTAEAGAPAECEERPGATTLKTRHSLELEASKVISRRCTFAFKTNPPASARHENDAQSSNWLSCARLPTFSRSSPFRVHLLASVSVSMSLGSLQPAQEITGLQSLEYEMSRKLDVLKQAPGGGKVRADRRWQGSSSITFSTYVPPPPPNFA